MTELPLGETRKIKSNAATPLIGGSARTPRNVQFTHQIEEVERLASAQYRSRANFENSRIQFFRWTRAGVNKLRAGQH